MAISQQHITGFIIGVGTAAAGYYAYKKNQEKIHDFLESQGIHLPRPGMHSNTGSMSLEELVLEKERLEDIIAEKELHMKEEKQGKNSKK